MYENPFRHEAQRRREQLDRAARDCFQPRRRWMPPFLPRLRAWTSRVRRLFPIRVTFGPCCDPSDGIQPSN